MTKGTLWRLIIFLCLGLGLLAIYGDFFGNVTIQNSALELLKLAVGAFLGAWANELAKPDPPAAATTATPATATPPTPAAPSPPPKP